MEKLDPQSTAVWLHMINVDLIAALRSDDVEGIKEALTQLRTFSTLVLQDYLDS